MRESEKKNHRKINTVPHRGNPKAKTLCDGTGNTGNGNTFSHHTSSQCCFATLTAGVMRKKHNSESHAQTDKAFETGW